MVHTTGSRQLFAMRPATALRLLIGAALLLALVGLTAVLTAQRADAGAVGTLVVNSTANTDDGDCGGPPNNQAVGNCTLHEAIDQVNLGLADTIKFHPAVFPKQSPGVIDLESFDTDDTLQGYDIDYPGLPPIQREVTIDNTGTHVVLDCDAQNNQTWGCGYGLLVTATHNAFDFKIIGGKQFDIREIGEEDVSNGCSLNTRGDGIDIFGYDPVTGGGGCGTPGDFSLGVVDISGVEIDVNDNEFGPANGGSAIRMEATNLNNIDISNSILLGDDDGDWDHGVKLEAYGNSNGDLTNNNVDIITSRIFGGDGIDIDFFGDLYSPSGLNGAGHVINVNVDDNEQVTGNAGDGVEIGYCRNEGGNCNARLSDINFNVRDNGKISSVDDNNGNGDGVRLTVEATETGCVPACNMGVDTMLNVTGNAIIDGADDDGVKVDIEICCSTSNSTATVNVNNNLDIVGDEDGVDLDVDVGEGPDNVVNLNVNDNGEITGEGDDGVDIDGDVGSDAQEDIDSDENELNVSVSGNDDIAGDNDDGVDVDATAGKQNGAGDADRNIVTVVVDDNGNIDGDDDGVSVDARAGTEFGPGDADNNLTTVSVSGNGTVDGADDEGIDVDVIAGHIAEGTPFPNVTGDNNDTEVTVDGNDAVKGHDGHGVQVRSRAGGLEPTGEENHTTVDVTHNGEIRGMQFEHDGVHIESTVCCDPDNENGGQTNNVNISDNEDIIGQDGDGIDIDRLCCSVNTVTINNNDGVIKGNEDNGIEVSPCLNSGTPSDTTSFDFGTGPEGDLTCIGESVTFLIVTGNNISNSGRDGLQVCCGAFQFPTTSGAIGKSLIANNTISHNGEDGVDLDTTIGVNIEHNQIFQNGTSARDGDNGVEIDWQHAYYIYNGALQAQSIVKVPAHYNRISDNDIHDNVGLGINLIGIVSLNPLIAVPASGTEGPGWPTADGVGCIQYPNTPIAANDCINYPKLLFSGGVGNKLGGSACSNCTVEIFYADETPADQTGPLGRQHGEGMRDGVGSDYMIIDTEVDGIGKFSVDLPCGMPAGLLTATATDKLKNTSEFASNIPFPGTPACATVTPVPPTATNTPPPTNTPVVAPPTATPTATAGPAKMCGDVNDDGLVNSIDAQLILQLKANLISSLPNEPSGDVNDDGQLTSVDAALILQRTAGLIPQSALHCP